MSITSMKLHLLCPPRQVSPVTPPLLHLPFWQTPGLPGQGDGRSEHRGAKFLRYSVGICCRQLQCLELTHCVVATKLARQSARSGWMIFISKYSVDIHISGPPTFSTTASGNLTDPILVLDSSTSPPANSEADSSGSSTRYLVIDSRLYFTDCFYWVAVGISDRLAGDEN